ncbi:MAG TPA: ABC transporter ATP-binding protein [Candidatus Dormibacteraeota bacterium]|nr:ABC transporter ATP-binding protein [Candidatus Dormibacteraeota bacterium]
MQEIAHPPQLGAAILEAEALVAGYFEDIHILKGISVKAWPGHVACILGPNGTGKSTLLKAVFGFLRPVSGHVRYEGREITGMAPESMLANGIAYLPQHPSIFPFLSVEVNLKLGLWGRRLSRAQIAERIAEACSQFPVLEEKRRQPAGQLSGGQQRQLEMARSLLTDPKVYLIDEPTAGVDPKTSAEIYRRIRSLARERGKAVLLVDQDIRRALEIADYVYVVRTGALLDQGPRDRFGGDTAELVARWLHASGEA